ncbi:MAG: hypothetical protein ACRDRY_07165 [Pseudonocardiaceae bacterium]
MDIYPAPAVPVWVARSAMEVYDLERLAFVRYRSSDNRIERIRAESVGRAVLWVSGADVAAPITDRREQPVTTALAKAEFWAAMAAYDGGGTPERVVRAECSRLGVAFRAPDPLPAGWAGRHGFDPADEVAIERGGAVYHTLGWLLRHPDGGPTCATPPLPLPVRGVDGRAVTAEQVYGQTVASGAYWGRFKLPEQDGELRAWAQGEAREYERLVALAEQVTAANLA